MTDDRSRPEVNTGMCGGFVEPSAVADVLNEQRVSIGVLDILATSHSSRSINASVHCISGSSITISVM